MLLLLLPILSIFLLWCCMRLLTLTWRNLLARLLSDGVEKVIKIQVGLRAAPVNRQTTIICQTSTRVERLRRYLLRPHNTEPCRKDFDWDAINTSVFEYKLTRPIPNSFQLADWIIYKSYGHMSIWAYEHMEFISGLVEIHFRVIHEIHHSTNILFQLRNSNLTDSKWLLGTSDHFRSL